MANAIVPMTLCAGNDLNLRRCAAAPPDHGPSAQSAVTRWLFAMQHPVDKDIRRGR